MIDARSAPMGWASLLHELTDAHDHLGDSIAALQATGDMANVDFTVDLGHVCAHLNRAWSMRDSPDGLHEGDWERASAFPLDLKPIG